MRNLKLSASMVIVSVTVVLLTPVVHAGVGEVARDVAKSASIDAGLAGTHAIGSSLNLRCKEIAVRANMAATPMSGPKFDLRLKYPIRWSPTLLGNEADAAHFPLSPTSSWPDRGQDACGTGSSSASDRLLNQTLPDPAFCTLLSPCGVCVRAGRS